MIKESPADSYSSYKEALYNFQYLLSSDFSCSNYITSVWGKYLFARRIVSSQATFSRSEIQSHPRLNFASSFFRLPRFHYSTIWRVADRLFDTDLCETHLGRTYWRKYFQEIRESNRETSSIKIRSAPEVTDMLVRIVSW